jgi:hypothetical protein
VQDSVSISEAEKHLSIRSLRAKSTKKSDPCIVDTRGKSEKTKNRFQSLSRPSHLATREHPPDGRVSNPGHRGRSSKNTYTRETR